MPAATTAHAEEVVEKNDAPPPSRGKKKLIVILIAVLLAVLAGGGAAVYLVKKKAAASADAEEGYEDENAEEEQAAAPDSRMRDPNAAAPTFVPLDAFVVNLADKDIERYAQVGVTLEIDDPKFAEKLKLYMPAIRNGILMVLAHKTSQELLGREGKEALAREILREAVLPLGIELDAAGKPVVPKGEDKDPVRNPVTHVHFSNFIIQ